MTCVALERRRLIEDDRLVIDEFNRGVTLVTLNACVAAGQWHLGALVVVERRRHPPLRIVARLTRRFTGVILELAAVWFHVARLTIRRRAFELNFLRTDGNFMTRAASDGAMGANQREFRFCVIEARHIRPGFRVVAGFTTEAATVGAFAFHAILEFAVMRVGVASGAGHIVEAERQNFVRTMRFPSSVATRARNGGVRASQRKA